MNIKQAKEQIKNAMTAYFTKDEFENYVIPIEKQRPIFMMGPPGIGKTAIMEQIAAELNVGLVSYSMTHHTRQSALGLPFIVKKKYGGIEYDVSEYTMSEIIASVYDMIETTGHKEGILFLDEINCVSETLAPAMLQFLQYKIFGRHKVPDGWIVVTAGNPPEFNDSVREFDIVTWDRLKRVDVTPDYDIWKEYAYLKGVHPAITTYLDIKKEHFYKIETTVDGKTFVTARGWSDLSDMIYLYEKNNIVVNDTLISQYIQNQKISKDFSNYYDLFNKYKSDYKIKDILSGQYFDEIVSRATNAKFDERIALLGLIIDAITSETKNINHEEAVIKEILPLLRNIKKIFSQSNTEDFVTPITDAIIEEENILKVGKKSSSISSEDIKMHNAAIKSLDNIKNILISNMPSDSDSAFKLVNDYFNNMVNSMKKGATSVKQEFSNCFKFLEEAFCEGQEILIFVTEITANYHTAYFIGHYGCEEYFKHNKDLLFYERQKEIISEIEELNL